MKNFFITAIIIILLALGIYLIIPKSSTKYSSDNSDIATTEENSQENDTAVATTTPEKETEAILGKSAGGRDIPVYKFGSGEKNILFVGGIHGGYSWNTSLLAQETIDYLKENPTIIPSNVTVTIIPILNPDGLDKTVGDSTLSDLAKNPPILANTVSGRFNGNNVDLNRNFDCDWQAEGIWQNKKVSGGSEPFSEPEAREIKKLIETEKPIAVIVWYSSAGGVYSSSCHNGILEETKNLTNIYGEASGYKTYDKFSSYEVTGDMVNWLAKINIPAISVLLTDHNNTEWEKNKAGIEAVLDYYSKK